MSDSARCMWMRGGTSKGAYFLAEDLPQQRSERDQFLLRIMGSPDPRQIDGIGGANPLTSKVALVQRSEKSGIDVDFLFLQVFVDQAIVSDAQPCGNILAGVGPFAIERGLVAAKADTTPVRIFTQNSGQIATALISTPKGKVNYQGSARIDGVPGTAAEILIEFSDIAGANCGALLPTGNQRDLIDGIAVTCIDNGMPVVLLAATDFGLSGNEAPETLEQNPRLRQRLEAIRLQAGSLMNLGDVSQKSVPKMCLISAPQHGGCLTTRTFIPHRCHDAIGVLGAVSVATACLLEDSVASELAQLPAGDHKKLSVEHPSGEMTVVLTPTKDSQEFRAAILRTARKLFDGEVFG
ncbi:4-oxalomesaconate tautomerase [Shewanella yunxiaonensis]|nr:4-oxalomesaconate tautomerase [Shewanella yunxiaonensis]